MAEDNDQGWWGRVREELGTNPWDWVAAGVGAGGGLAASASIAGLDAGASIGIGALGAVTARRAAVASRRGVNLRAKAEGLLKAVRQEASTQSRDELQRLARSVERDTQLWEKKVLSHEQFDGLLDQAIGRFRQLTDL